MIQEDKIRRRLDPAKTRDSIMRAALKLFADKGYKGTSISEIAQAAHVRKSLIQYHFGTKEQLWSACLESRAAPMIAAIDEMIEMGEQDLGHLVRIRFQFLRDNPEVRRLLAWATTGSVPTPDFIVERRKRLVDSPNRGFDAARLARFLFALSATDGWFHFRSLYGAIAGEEALSDEVEQEFVKILGEVATKLA